MPCSNPLQVIAQSAPVTPQHGMQPQPQTKLSEEELEKVFQQLGTVTGKRLAFLLLLVLSLLSHSPGLALLEFSWVS